MSLEENKAIILRLMEAFNMHSTALLDELIAPDFVDHYHQLRGLESYKKHVTMSIKGFADLHLTTEDMIAERDKVWVRIKEMGTHAGEFRGLAPTGKKVTFTVVHIWRIVDGKVVERVSLFLIGFLQTTRHH